MATALTQALAAFTTRYRVTTWVRYEGSSVGTFVTWEDAVDAYELALENVERGYADGAELSEVKVLFTA